MARLTRLQCAAVLLLVVMMLLACRSSSAAAATTAAAMERYHNHISRKLLVAVPRTSPETAESRGQQAEMDVSDWRTTAPFRRPGASLGRRVPGSRANPSHN
ncbi:hypothetical protein ABZP36_023163 [Zizania latifolia]